MTPDPGDHLPDGGPGKEYHGKLLFMLSVMDPEDRTWYNIQKFAAFLTRRDHGTFIMSIDKHGAHTKEIHDGINRLQNAGFLKPRTETKDRPAKLTDKARNWLNQSEPSFDYQKYWGFFRTINGQNGNWKWNDNTEFKWLKNDDNYIAYNEPLYEAIKKRVQHDKGFDPRFVEIYNEEDFSEVSRVNREIREIAGHAFYLLKRAKAAFREKDEDDDDFQDYDERLDVERILSAEEMEGKFVLIRGFVETLEDENTLHVKEDRLKHSKSIRVNFHGEWEVPPRSLLDRIIGVFGYCKNVAGDRNIEAVAILDWHQAPKEIRCRYEVNDDYKDWQDRTSKRLFDKHAKFFEDGEVSDSDIRDIGRIESVSELRRRIQGLRDEFPESEEVQEWLDEFEENAVERFRDISTDVALGYLWYEIAREIVKLLANLFK